MLTNMMQCAAYGLSTSTSAVMLAAIIRLLSKDNLLGHLYVEQQSFYQTLRKFFTMRCHVEIPVTSMRECESDNTKFNIPAPHSHLRSCNINESLDTGEGKWLIGQFSPSESAMDAILPSLFLIYSFKR
ncbi:hypothetical protein AMECASPLE_017905 [Ameca splendens]|uniref:Uncharacterized protein n=1 Tax=Ameca splendens TaxID=208324 RepID=A0ABV0Z0J8_9TELE